MSTEQSFGQLVKTRRRELGLTQDELARRVGCAPVTLRNIEYDDLRPSVQIAERLAMALNIALEERAAFVRLARAERQPEPITPTPAPRPEEIGIEDLTGKAIRGYALGERIGNGGMGAVYRATQPHVEREVAIKIILPQYANHPDFIRRFEAEAQLVARLEHPHIVPLYDYWREPGSAYLIMRLLRGGSVRGLLERGSLPVEQTLRLVEQIGSALNAAHRAGVIHRDLKPGNVLLDEDSNAYLADFGIAKNLSNPNLEDMTQADAIVGSPAYISPEQIRSEFVRPQTDIYCLGVMLYELLTGTVPFAGPTPIEVMHQHLSAPLPPLAAHRSGLPAALDAVIERATAKDPLERYENVEELLKDMRRAIGRTEIGGLEIRELGVNLQSSNPLILTADDNPYKGLRAFGEGDAQDFFGREALTQQLLVRMGEGGDLARFLAVVGPSGSGKSSVVGAGLVPALRRGALPGSDQWFIVEMMPGPHPLEELEAALLRVAVTPAVATLHATSLLAQLKEDKRGLLRAVRRCLPEDPNVELVLVIDQFEEVFTLVQDEALRAHFLDSLVTAALDERSRVRVLVTLRADFTDRPLNYVDFGELLRQRMEVVLPLTPDELERAIVGPAERVGLQLEPGLVTAILHDVSDQPGALPLLQYALTELFEKRDGHTLTKKAYAEVGGVLGALGRRAEEVFASLDTDGQALARQLFLRLVTLGEGVEDTRRRVLRAELESLSTKDTKKHEENLSVLRGLIEVFGKHRLLSFDRDPVTRGPTVEVAHEALLHEWPRLREWLSESRADVRLQRQLATAAAEWQRAKNEVSFLLTGAKLEQFEGWAANTTVALTSDEQAYLEAGLAERDRRAIEEQTRQRRELDGARKLAETERARADEQVHYVARVRTRNRVITTVGAVAMMLAVLAGLFGLQSNQNATQAEQNAQAALTAEAIAVANAEAAQKAEAEAIRQQRLTLSRELAGSAIINLDVDPERSILLGMQAVTTTYAVDGTTTKEAVEALHRAVLNSRLRLTLYPEPGDGYGLAWSPDGKLFATSTTDGQIKLWDLNSPQELFILTGHEGHIYNLAFSPAERGSYLASASADGTAKIWDLDTKQMILDLRGHTDEVFSVDFSQDGNRIVTASIDGTAKVWDTLNGQLLLTFAGHEAPVLWAQFNPEGTRVATAGDDGRVRVWDSVSGQELYVLTDFLIFVSGTAFSPDGKILATNGGTDPKLWDAETGELLFLLPGFNSGSAQGPVFTPDGKYVAVAGQDGTVSMWETATGLQYLTFATGTPVDGQIEFSPECVGPPAASYTWCGVYLVTGNRDGSVRFWDVSPAGSREVMNVPGRWNCLESDGMTLHTAAPEGEGNAQFRTLQLPSVASVIESSHPLSYPLQELSSYSVGFSGGLPHFAFSPDCSRSAVVDRANLGVTITDTANGKQLLQFNLAEGTSSLFALGSSSFSPDGMRFATIGPENTAKVYDLTNGGQESLTLQGHTAAVITVNFSPDGKQIATTSEDRTIKLWDAETGQELRTFSGHTSVTSRVIFNPEGTRLATGSFDRTVKVWDLETGEELYTLSGHGATVWGIRFSPDGKLIATGSNDLTLRLWDAMTGKELFTLPIPAGSFQSFFTPDQTRLVVQTVGGTHVYLTQIEDLLALAKSRVSRTLTTEECQKYLHVEACPQR